MAEEQTKTNEVAETTTTTPTPSTEPNKSVETVQPVTTEKKVEEQPVVTATVEPKPGEVGENKETVEVDPATPAGDSFTISDIEWPDELGLDDAGKTELFNNHKELFKGKGEVNKYLKSIAEATKINKENQAKKVKELELSWETELKTDGDYGKNFEGNNKLVTDTMKKYASEADMHELEKFGFTKSPALKRMILKIAREFDGAKVVKGQSPISTSKTKTDAFGNTTFDFTKKQ